MCMAILHRSSASRKRSDRRRMAPPVSLYRPSTTLELPTERIQLHHTEVACLHLLQCKVSNMPTTQDERRDQADTTHNATLTSMHRAEQTLHLRSSWRSLCRVQTIPYHVHLSATLSGTTQGPIGPDGVLTGCAIPPSRLCYLSFSGTEDEGWSFRNVFCAVDQWLWTGR